MAGRGEGKGQEQCHSHSVSATADYESRWTSPGFVCGRIRTTWDMKPHRFRRSRLRFAGDARGGARRHQCLGGPADARPHPRADPGWPCDERCAAGAEHGGVLQGRLAARQRVRHGATQRRNVRALRQTAAVGGRGHHPLPVDASAAGYAAPRTGPRPRQRQQPSSFRRAARPNRSRRSRCAAIAPSSSPSATSPSARRCSSARSRTPAWA